MALSTNSSILAGWIRPSLIKFSKATRAIWRRTGSNEERTIEPGVSSIITSTPVAFSKALMLRPSLPIILPLMSSEGISTVVDITSGTVLVERRWIMVAKMSLARRSSSVSALASNLRWRAIKSSAFSCSMVDKSSVLASSVESLATRSNSFLRSSANLSARSLICLISSTWRLICSASLSISFWRRSKVSSFLIKRSSVRLSSFSFSFSCSLASVKRRLASSSASLTIFWAWSLAANIVSLTESSSDPFWPKVTNHLRK